MATFKKIGSFGIDKSLKKYNVFERTTPILLANNTENHFKSGFRLGGMKTDKSLGGWDQRAFTKGKGIRNVLIKSGALQRDISKRHVSAKRIVVGTSSLTKKYASIHNDGGKVRITEKSRKFFWKQYYEASNKAEKTYWKNLALTKKSSFDIPQREYIGDSKELERSNESIINRQLNKIFK